MVKTNSLRAWWLAARPKTLTGAAAPVILAVSAAYGIYGQIEWTPALLCMVFALLMQTDANLVNDYFDCIRGVDTEERLGPESFLLRKPSPLQRPVLQTCQKRLPKRELYLCCRK